MTMRNNAAFLAAVGALTLFTVTGCSDKTQQAASNTVDSAAQDAQNHTEAAGQAVETGAQKVEEGAKKTGEAVEEGARKTGEAVEKTGEYVGESVGGAVKNADKEIKDIGQVTTLTPAIKDELIKSKIDASTINVDTSGEKDTVYLKGKVASASQKQMAEQIAKRVLSEKGANFKIKNELQVGAPGPKAN